MSDLEMKRRIVDRQRLSETLEALTWMADAGIDLHILQRVAGHQDPAVTARYLHPDVQAMLDAGTAFSAWWSVVGPERPPLGVIEGGKNAG